MDYESRLSKHGAAELHRGTAGDGSDKSSNSPNYSVTICETEEDLLVQ